MNQELFIIVIVLLLAAFLFFVFYAFLQIKKLQDQLANNKHEYEEKIHSLHLTHQQEIEKARRQSVQQSRNTIKGQLAEQIAPLLPGFPYHPSDCRFVGAPIDYVIFNGYTENQGKPENNMIEVVMLEIKKCRAALSEGQEKIANATAVQNNSRQEIASAVCRGLNRDFGQS